MSALAISAIVFACVFGGALFGMLLGRILPEHHLSTDAKDVIKVAMAMVATLAALVLGLMIASAKSSLDDKEAELRSTASEPETRNVIWLLDRFPNIRYLVDLHSYGETHPPQLGHRRKPVR